MTQAGRRNDIMGGEGSCPNPTRSLIQASLHFEAETVYIACVDLEVIVIYLCAGGTIKSWSSNRCYRRYKEQISMHAYDARDATLWLYLKMDKLEKSDKGTIVSNRDRPAALGNSGAVTKQANTLAMLDDTC